jgi:hypothetical protein
MVAIIPHMLSALSDVLQNVIIQMDGFEIKCTYVQIELQTAADTCSILTFI